MFGFLMLREREPKPAAAAPGPASVQYKSHQDLMQRLLLPDAIAVSPVMEINKAFRHCRIGKIKLK